MAAAVVIRWITQADCVIPILAATFISNSFSNSVMRILTLSVLYFDMGKGYTTQQRICEHNLRRRYEKADFGDGGNGAGGVR
ncbi:MAG: hypothetical protein M0Z43_09680 [Acidithiobacillus sp.]|nr:hypothetical protein [Acidithiobacillus sp.]